MQGTDRPVTARLIIICNEIREEPKKIRPHQLPVPRRTNGELARPVLLRPRITLTAERGGVGSRSRPYQPRGFHRPTLMDIVTGLSVDTDGDWFPWSSYWNAYAAPAMLTEGWWKKASYCGQVPPAG
jgi:hypothetical protein